MTLSRRGESPGETPLLRAPRAGLTAPQTSRTSQNREAGKKRVRGSESKTAPAQQAPGREPGRLHPQGKPPGRNTPPARPLCRPRGPADLPDVPKTPGGRQKACTRLWERNRDIQTAGAALGKPGDGSGASPRSALFQHGDDGGTGQARRNGAGSRAGCDRVRAGNGRRPRADALRRRPAGRQGRTHGTRDPGETAVNGS